MKLWWRLPVFYKNNDLMIWPQTFHPKEEVTFKSKLEFNLKESGFGLGEVSQIRISIVYIERGESKKKTRLVCLKHSWNQHQSAASKCKWADPGLSLFRLLIYWKWYFKHQLKLVKPISRPFKACKANVIHSRIKSTRLSVQSPPDLWLGHHCKYNV